MDKFNKELEETLNRVMDNTYENHRYLGKTNSDEHKITIEVIVKQQ
ncbi:hypothetical protein G6R29_05300 [Fructobacillus sp. M2-14]|uniref:Uncharacterized protein n=1 Tax=Fructobacillus broussonetiae TaxID=2713173 RepID=A0ABS5R0R9_9LACO|nr:hypothetical protein [Fructobacillus broussonetiae]MBS9339036.1 hypothetical protein [Fructobacillus broussonetiae]